MKKTLSMLAVLGIIAVGAQTAQAAWYDSNWNPSNWFGRGCNKCEKKCDPCATGYAAPCNPCEKKVIQPCPCQKSNPCPVQQPCDPCDKLQNMNK
ncbi:MAG: hypothetical protein E7Z92_02490 [Cyanobacteria bacterium SIG31]|nr:hypothetical protein [Cyanobacteria bacterium SIG31]